MKYIIFTIIAGFCYSLMSVFIKIAYNFSNEPTITFFRFFSALAMLLPIYFISGKPSIKTKVPYLHLIRGIFSFLMFTLYTISLQYIPVENALALNSTYPLFIPLILFFVFKESISFNTVIGIIVGFVGVYMIINPSASDYMSWAAVLALVSAICSAASNVTIRTLRKTESSFSIVFYFFLIATIVSFFYMLLMDTQINTQAIWLLLGIAATSLGSQQLLSYVLKYLHPNLVSSLMYSSIVFGFLFSWWFWGKTPTALEIVGTLVIISGTIILKSKTTSVKQVQKKII
ncbi:DMT family transporter [Priestia megaterium]|uniref:DMT family transporter n=1 Tax=Priestia megaterium TaxID=1404 RepID=UPI001F188617|nr:DMT family transporter [Priestia megaterium]MCF8890337.1 DMT family transporter [Priestia megaterium]